MDYNLTKTEQETIISYDNQNDECDIYTCDRKLMNRLDGLCKKHPDAFKCKKQDKYSKTYIVPKKLVSIRAPKILSEEQKQKLREHSPFCKP